MPPGTVPSKKRTKGIILGGANLWGGGQSKDIARRLGRIAQDAGSRCQERVGVVETKERDNFTVELASNVTCHREAGTTSSVSQGPVDFANRLRDTGDYR